MKFLLIIGTTAVVVLFALFAMYAYNHYTYTIPISNSIVDKRLSDIHYELIHKKNDTRYFASLDTIIRQDDGSINILFSQNNYYLSNGERPIPVFSYYENIKINQTFVVLCNGEPLPTISILKYLGIHESKPVYMFLHENAMVQTQMNCDYPQIIQHSIDAKPLTVSSELLECSSCHLWRGEYATSMRTPP